MGSGILQFPSTLLVAAPATVSKSLRHRSGSLHRSPLPSSALRFNPLLYKTSSFRHNVIRRSGAGLVAVSASSSGNAAWEGWLPDKAANPPSLSDVVWPSLGSFVAMAVLGKMDQVLAAKGVSMTIAPLGAVCAVLFLTPSSPAAKKYNMFMAQIGCAAIGVLVFLILGPGWLARSAGLAASIAFMVYTRCTHPPAASLPLLFIDGAKLHHLNFWYALFPGAAGCILLSLIQEAVCYLKDNFKF